MILFDCDFFQLLERFSPTKSRRQIKTLGGKKKEESSFTEISPSVSQESPSYEKPLQTTNQVKANLINANMIKGDMILTKPGQGRSNQKVTFIQKQVKPNELKNIGLKKAVVSLVSKEKFVNQTGTKLFATKDGKLLQIPVTAKTITPNTQVSPVKAILTQQPTSQSVTSQQSANQGSPIQQQSKTVLSPIKIKPSDIKREKRKSDTSIESLLKTEENSAKSVEIKTLDS